MKYSRVYTSTDRPAVYHFCVDGKVIGTKYSIHLLMYLALFQYNFSPLQNHLEVQTNPKECCAKKYSYPYGKKRINIYHVPFKKMGETKLYNDNYLKFSLWPCELFKVKGCLRLNFVILTSTFFNLKKLETDLNLIYVWQTSVRQTLSLRTSRWVTSTPFGIPFCLPTQF